MNNQNYQGIDMPQLDLSNFIPTGSTKIDMNKYFQTLGDVTIKITDETIKAEIIHRYITQRRERNPKFDKAYNEFFCSIFDNTFQCEVKKAFKVANFYPTKDVKAKLKALYNHEFAPEEFYRKTPKMTDLIKNSWFDMMYIKNEDGVNGILITDCLI